MTVRLVVQKKPLRLPILYCSCSQLFRHVVSLQEICKIWWNVIAWDICKMWHYVSTLIYRPLNLRFSHREGTAGHYSNRVATLQVMATDVLGYCMAVCCSVAPAAEFACTFCNYVATTLKLPLLRKLRFFSLGSYKWRLKWKKCKRV